MIVIDLEIKKAIPGREPKIEGIEYCAGWGDHAGMGISVMVAYDYKNSRYRVFEDDNKAEAKALIESAQFVYGFNTILFDHKVLKACWDIEVPEEKIYDLKQKLGHWKVPKLDLLAKYNLGISKSGEGAFAPILWQQGKRGQVIDYCMMDVYITKCLMDLVAKQGTLHGESESQLYYVGLRPTEILQYIERNSK